MPIVFCPMISNTLTEPGYNFNEKQKITFAGTISTNNFNNGSTVYMTNYVTPLGKVADIINGAVSAYANLKESPEAKSNLQNDKGEFIFVSFIFNDLMSGAEGINDSLVNYKDIDNAGIIDASELTGVDTTHKFISMDVQIAGVGSMGKALLYNLNYGKTVE